MTNETNAIETAFQKAQTSFSHARKDATNPHFKSKYSTLKAVQEAVYPALSEHGISVHFGVCWHPETLQPYALKCMLRKGEGSIETMVPCNFTGTPQQQMSAMTYAKRASLAAVTGVILDDDSDDDGNAANDAPKQPSKPTFKKIMGDIKNCNDMNRLMQIKKFVEANADTSKAKLLEMIAEREHDLADRANDLEDYVDGDDG